MKNVKVFLLGLLVVCMDSTVTAQTTLSTTVPASFSLPSYTDQGVVVFGLKNTNSTSITITTIANYLQANYSGTYDLWYNPTTVTGAPGLIIPANGWIQLTEPVNVSNGSTAGVNTVLSNLKVVVPPNATYRFAIHSSVEGPYYGGSGSSANIFTAGGVELYAQDNANSPTYAGLFPGAPGNTPRSFCGSVTFLTNPAAVPNNAGVASIKAPSLSCPGTHEVKARIMNYGSNLINNVQVNWELDGVLQTPINWTTPIDVAGSGNADSALVTLGNISFSARGRNIRVWTSLPNGIADAETSNDEFQIRLRTRLNGNYTIGGSTPDYATFDEAMKALYAGVCGPVKFTVAENSGPYNEQVLIPAIAGVSSTNRVTIKGNGNTIQFAPTTASRHVVKLVAAKYVTLDSLRIAVASATDFGYGIHLRSGSSNDSIKNCIIDMSAITGTTAANSAGITASNSNTSPTATGDNTRNLVISGCEIIGGSSGIDIYGHSTDANALSANNKIVNNTVRDFYIDGIVLSYNDGTLVANNNVNRATRATVGTPFSGIEIGVGCKNVTVDANRIHDTHTAATTQTGAAYGVFVNACDAAVGSENRVTNNLIYNFNGNSSGAQYGLYNSSSDGVFFYHNTVVLDGPGTTGVARGFYQTTLATNIKVQNNIFKVSRAGTGLKYCLYFNTTTSSITSNNNVLYSTGGIGSLSTTGYSTLADWKAANANAYDQQSVSVDPLFNNAGAFDYTPFEAAVNGIGTNVGVTTDITGAARSATAPDPGAYEFSVAGLDAAIGWVAPVMPATPGMKTVTVSIANTQTTPITAINLSYTDGTIIQTQNFTGLNIGAGTTQQLSFTTQYNLAISTRLKAYINSVNGITDNSQLNDSTANQVICLPLAGAYTIDNAMPTTGTNFNSFNDAVNQLICSGVSAPVTFYVQAGAFAGVYNEQVTIPAITGASATKKITFKGNQNTLQFAPVTANRHVIKLDGADHIVIDSLNITSTAADFGWGVHFINGADSNVIKHCIIDLSANTSTSESNSGGIVFSGSTTSAITAGNANYNIIDSNTIKGAYKGIALYGSTTATGAVKNRITHNIIQDFYASGMELVGNDSTVVAGNDISRATRATVTTFAGVEIGANSKKVVVNANRIHDTHNAATAQTGAAYGVYLNACDAVVGSENIVTNNLIYNFNSSTTGAQYGMYNSGSDGVFYYHNTIVLDGPGTTGIARGVYQTTAATNIQVINNVVSISRAGTGLKYCLYFNTTTSTIVSNNNVLYNSTTTGGVGSFSTTGFATLTDWKTANSNAYDQASASTDPLFASPSGGDYTPTAPSINNIGANVGIVADILGTARTATPDPGAYEFELGGCTNPAIAGNAVSSDTTACAGSTFTLDLAGNSTGAGQTYQWQSSPDNNVWTNIGTAQTTTGYATSQSLGTTYYRCVVKCASGTPVNSTSVRVVSQTVTSGVFTINSAVATGGSNFQSFTDAVNRIKCGINGPVEFNVVANSGPYNEQVIMPDIPGTSSTNTITINGNGTTLTYLSTSSNERAVIKLKGTDYVTIDSLVIQAQGSAATDYGYGIQLVDNADHNTIKRCSITVTSTPATAASTAFAGIVINASTAATPIATGVSLCDSNTIHKNTITGGYCGIAVTANGITSTMNGNNITDNTVTDFYIYGISVNGNQNAIISGNDISRPTRSSVSTFYGVDVNGAVGLTITRNKIHASHSGATTATAAAYGIYHSVSDATISAPNIVSNNMVYEFNNLGTQYGFYNTGSDSVKYYHNSVYLDNQNATASNTYDTRCFYQVTAATGIELKNNIFYISRNCIGENHCVYFSTAGTTFTSDYNDLLITSTAGTLNNIAYASATQYTNLAAWQASTGTPDTHSKNVDPLFISASDLHLMGSSPLDDQGTAIPQVTVDIDGQARSASTPDIGADEMPPVAGLDMKPEALVTPSNANGCYTTETITVRVKNNSTSTINFATNPVTVAVAVTGVVTANYSTVVNTGTLAFGATLDVTMATPSATLAMTANGTYNFAISTSVTGDVNASNDLLNISKERVALAVGTVTTSKDAYCITGGTPTFTATGILGYSSIKWQQSTTSGSGFADIPGATSNPYTLTGNITQTTYFRIVATCGAQTVNSGEDTVVYSNPAITSTLPGTRCGTGTVNLSATGNGSTVAWYANATGGTPLATGNTFTTPSISNTTTYYVATSDGGSTFNAGKLAPEATATATVLSTYGHIITFNKKVLLNSAQVFSTTGTAITISLYNSDGTTQLMTSGSRAVVAGTSPHISLGWTIPAGTYRLAANAMTGNFYRDGVTTPSVVYPIALGTAGQINGYHTSITGALTTGFAYYFMYNLSITDGCESARTAVTATVDCSVPITLLSFKGERAGSINRLQWATSTEVNSAGFELERSADGTNFSSLSFMASKAANGNSNAQLTYGFDDVRPLLGNAYYRLRQVDRDGKSSYSNVVLIKGSRPASLAISSVYPNPVRAKLNMVLTSPGNDRVTVIVTDLAGKVVSSGSLAVAVGDNTYQLDVSALSSGSYFIKAVCGNGCETAVQKFVK